MNLLCKGLLAVFVIIVHTNEVFSALPTYTPALHRNTQYLARDSLIKAYFKQGYRNKEIVSFLFICHGIVVCVRTVKRVLKRLNLKRKILCDDHQATEALNAIATELKTSGKCLGYKSMWRRLKDQNIFIPRVYVRRALLILDPKGVASRRKRRLQRRMCVNPGPNFVWHIDGYDKLKPYGFAIHGAIDGYSRRILWLEIGNSNNNPSVVATYFLETVLQLNTYPCIVRADRGTENVYVCKIFRYLRSNQTDIFSGDDCFMYGKSTGNQRIESWWGLMRKQGINFWINLFKDMVAIGVLDTSDCVHIHALRFCFMNLISENLKRIALEWNRHHIRKINAAEGTNGKPDILYFTPDIKGTESFGMSDGMDEIPIIIHELECDPTIKPDHDADFIQLVSALVPDWEEPATVNDAMCLYAKILVEILKLDNSN